LREDEGGGEDKNAVKTKKWMPNLFNIPIDYLQYMKWKKRMYYSFFAMPKKQMWSYHRYLRKSKSRFRVFEF
jgi:hypothetical protein